MRNVCISFVAVFTAAIVCIGCAGSGVRVPVGEAAVLSPDGLHRANGIRSGTLFIRPNYAFGSYSAFTLGPTAVTFKQGSRVLEKEEVQELRASFESVARAAIGGTGRSEVAERAKCVALVTLGLVDLDLLDPKEVPQAGPDGLRVVGAVTLVMEIRDGHTNEPLLRYGQRQRLQHSSRNVRGDALVSIFERFARRFQKDFDRSISRLEQAEPPLSCEQRAGRA
jgi:hypothetical protein